MRATSRAEHDTAVLDLTGTVPQSHLGQLVLHTALIAVCFLMFLHKSLPSMRVDVNLSPPMALVYLATAHPEAISGGYFDHMNANIRNATYVAYSQLRRFFGHPTAAILLQYSIVVVVLASVYALALSLSRSPWIAFAVAAIMVNSELMGFPCIGANGLPSQTTAYCYLFLGVALLAFKFLVEGRLYAYAAMMPLAFLCHMPQGLLATAILVPAAWIMSGFDRRFLTVHLGSMGALVGGFYFFQRPQADVVTAGNSDLWFHYLHLLNCGHLYVDYGIGMWSSFYSFVAVMAAGAALCLALPQLRRPLLPALCTGLFLMALAQVFVYIVPLRIVYLLMPNRASNLLVALVLTYGLVELFKLCLGGTRSWVAWLAIFGLAAAAASWHVGTFLLAGVLCVYAAARSRGPVRVVCCALAVGLAFWYANLGVEATLYWNGFRQTDRDWLLAISALVASAWLLAIRRGPMTWPKHWFGAALALSLGIATAWTPNLVDYTRPQFDTLVAQLDEFYSLGRWVNAHVPPGEPVLVPPDTTMPFFEVASERGALLQLSKTAWVYSCPQLLTTFDAVLLDFGIDLRQYDSHREIWTRPIETWKAIPGDRFHELAMKYGARLVVTYADHQLDLPVLYRGDYYVVYEAASPTNVVADAASTAGGKR